MSVFVHAQRIKTVHAGGGGKKWQNFVHVVVECPLKINVKVTECLTKYRSLLFMVQDRNKLETW